MGVRFISCFCKINAKSAISELTFFRKYCIIIVINYKRKWERTHFMPISDKVIELETKKKGRNILFIVLIAVLATASVAFAVLWVTKAPAIDPPSIEKISVGSGKTDLSQVNDPLDTEAPQLVYRVAPNVAYNMEFNVVLKSNNYTKDDVNSLIKVYSEPAAAIIPLKTEYVGSGEDDVVAVVVFGFRVSETMRDNFKLIVTSEFSPEVREVIEMKVEEGFAEYFEADDYADSDGNVTEGMKAIAPINLKKEVNGSITVFREAGKGDPLELALQQDKSTDASRFYRVVKQIPYYESTSGTDLRENNLEHEFDFSQLGAVGTNGKRAKIMQGVMGNGGYHDQVRVFVANGWNLEDSEYKEITDSATKCGNLEFNLHPHSSDGAYCRKNLRFKALGAGKSTIKLVANEYNGAPVKREIIIEVEFLPSSEMDVVTDIVCFDPYTKMRTDELDLYLDRPIGTSTQFVLSDYVKVVRKGLLTDPTWGMNNLYVQVKEGSELVNISTTPTSAKLSLKYKDRVGDATLLIENRETNNLRKSATVYLHIRAPINEVAVKADNPISTFSGDTTPKAEMSYTIGHTLFANDDAVSSLNSSLTISYSKEINSTDAAKTITVDGEIKVGDNKVLFPKLAKVTGSKDTLSAPLGFKIGADVPDGIHTVTFTLASQSLNEKKDEDGNVTGYEPAEKMSFEVKFKVVHTADSFKLNEDFNFTKNPDDKNTQLICNGNAATLVLEIGSGRPVTGESEKVTVFNLKDLILFYDKDGNPVTQSQDENYAFIVKTDNQGAYSKAADSFIVPSNSRESCSVKLELNDCVIVITVEYKYAVSGVQFKDSNDKNHKIYYENPELYSTGSEVVLLDNYKRDVPQLMSTTTPQIVLESKHNIINREYVSLDIAVKQNNYPYLLPKKAIGSSIYYFPLGTKESEMTDKHIGNALFKTRNTDILIDSTVVVLRDLFSLSVGEKKDWQTFSLFYGYGENIYTIQDGYIAGRDEKFSAVSHYTLYRRFDEVKLYTDATYSQELSASAPITVSSGDIFTAYPSGVIKMKDKSDFVVAHDNAAWHFACSSLAETYPLNTSSVERLGFGSYKLVCEPGKNYEGTFSFGEAEFEEDGKSVSVEVSVSNTQVSIASIELFADAQYTQPFLMPTLYTNAGRQSSADVYYKVTYAPKKPGDTAYEGFEYTLPHGFAVTGFNPAFLDEPFGNDITGFDGVSFGESGELIYEGKFEITRTTAPNEIYDGFAVVSANGGVSASSKIRVTTAVERAFTADLNANGLIVLSSDAVPQNVTVTYVPNGNNSYDILFNFAQNGNEIDRENLHYMAQFSYADGGAVRGIEGVFRSNTTDYFGNADTAEARKAITMYRFTALGTRIDDLLLTITVVETLDNREENTYELKLKITVDVGIETLGLKIGDAVYSGNGGKLDVITTGDSGEQQFALEAVINDGDENRKPQNDPELTYSLENASCENVFRVHDGKLGVANSQTQSASATLVLSAGGKEVRVLISVSTSKVSIAFDDKNIEEVRTDNSVINVKATVTNAGTNDPVKNAEITYTVKDDKNNIVVSNDPSSPNITVRGSFGTFTVVASYTSPEGVTVEASATVTVRVPASEIEVKNNAGTKLASGAKLELACGQSGNDCTFSVKALSAIAGLDPADTTLTVSSSADCVGATIENGTLTLNPLKAGSAVITVSGADGKTFAFNVNVSQAVLSVDFKDGNSEINVFSGYSADFSVTLSGVPSGYSFADVKIYIDGNEMSVGGTATGAFSVALTGINYYRVTVNRSALTAADIKAHTVRVTAQLQRNGADVLPLESSVNFEITAKQNAYTPKIELRKNGTLVLPAGDVYEIDKKLASEYKFVLANAPAVSYVATFVASNGSLTLTNANNSATFTISQCGNVSVSVNVVLFGDGAYSFTSSLEIVIADSGVLESKAYISDDEDGEITVNSDGSVTGATQIGENVDVSYESDPKVLALVVNFEGAPSALSNATLTDFIVSDNSALEFIKSEIRHGKFFVAYYKAKATGNIALGVHTSMLGGTVYSANTVSATLEAVMPEFTVTNASGITLNPGESVVVTVNNGNASDFKGALTYSATLRAEFAAVAQNESELNEFTVSAKKLLGGGNATLVVTVTVSGGLYNGYKETFEIPVTVNVYASPAISVTEEAKLAANQQTLDLGALLNVTHDSGDNSFAYEVEYTYDNIYGTLVVSQNKDGSGTYTRGEAAKDGAVFELGYTFKVTGGYYSGATPVKGTIKVTVMPASATLTVDGGVGISGVRYVSGNSKLTFTASVGNISREYIAASYSVDKSEWGSISGNTFVPAIYGGETVPASSEANITATVKIVGGDYAGAEYTVTERVCVTWLAKQSASSKFSAKAGERIDLKTLFKSADGNVLTGISISSDSAFVAQEGDYLKVLPNANYGTANKTVKLFVTHTDSNNRAYYGEFDFTVLPIAVPEFEVTQNGNTFVANDGKTFSGAQYKIDVLSGKELLDNYDTAYDVYSTENTFTLTPKTLSLGGNVVLRVFMKIEGGDYEGGTYDGNVWEKTVTLSVTGKRAPVLSEVGFKLSEDGNGGQITATIENGDGYTFGYAYAVTEGSGILLAPDGSFTFAKTSQKQSAKVTVSVTVSGEPYNGLVLTGITAEIEVLAATAPTLTANVQGGVIIPVVSSGDSATFSFALADQTQAKYINLNATTGEFKLKDSSFGGTIKIAVSASLTSGAYKGTSINCEATVTSVAAPVPGELSLGTLTPNAQINPVSFTGSFTFAGSGFEVLFVQVKEYSSRLSTHGATGFVITPNSESTPVKVTLYYRVKGDCSYTGEILSKGYDVPIPALPKLTATATSTKITVAFNYAHSGDFEFAVGDADKKYVTIDAQGNFVGSYESRTIPVTVSATVNGGVLGGLEFTFELEITTSVPTLTLEVTRNENGGAVVPSLSDGGENAQYEYTVTSGNSVTLASNTSGAFTAVSGRSGKTVIKVKATLESGAVVENTVEVVIAADSAGITATVGEGDTATTAGKIIYNVTFEGFNGTITAVKNNSEHVNAEISSNGITVTADYDEDGDEQTETLECDVMFENESGEYVFATVTFEVAYKVNATPVETPEIISEA